MYRKDIEISSKWAPAHTERFGEFIAVTQMMQPFVILTRSDSLSWDTKPSVIMVYLNSVKWKRIRSIKSNKQFSFKNFFSMAHLWVCEYETSDLVRCCMLYSFLKYTLALLPLNEWMNEWTNLCLTDCRENKKINVFNTLLIQKLWEKLNIYSWFALRWLTQMVMKVIKQKKFWFASYKVIYVMFVSQETLADN